MKSECAVCYVTDINYLLPSLVSATTLRRYVGPNKADIFIFLIDEENDTTVNLKRYLKHLAIEIHHFYSSAYSDIDIRKYKKSHVPLASVGRFFLDELLPSRFSKIVYIDGDTWINRDPSALVDATIPAGRFAAAEDTLYLQQHNSFSRSARKIRNYYNALGVREGNGYFNSGVFAVSRNTWRTLSREAYEFLLKNTELCVFHDQSAMNAVAGDRRLRLSCAWNFQTPYRYFVTENGIKPIIYHFNKPLKPWMGPVAPWQDMYLEYRTLADKEELATLPLKMADTNAIEKHNLRSRRKSLLSKSPILAGMARIYMGHNKLENMSWL